DARPARSRSRQSEFPQERHPILVVAEESACRPDTVGVDVEHARIDIARWTRHRVTMPAHRLRRNCLSQVGTLPSRGLAPDVAGRAYCVARWPTARRRPRATTTNSA